MTVRVPKYRFHKASGQALVEIAGRHFYLGKYIRQHSIEVRRIQRAVPIRENC